MAQKVEYKGNTVEFPDGMSEEAMLTALKKDDSLNIKVDKGDIGEYEEGFLQGKFKQGVGFSYSFLKSIVREIPSLIQINPKDKEKDFEYVGFKSLEPSDLKRELIRGYLKIVGNNLFIKIHKLWIHLKNVYLDLEEDIFDEHLLSLAKENIGSVELIQGVLEPGEKILHDPMSNTYYHYVKIKR